MNAAETIREMQGRLDALEHRLAVAVADVRREAGPSRLELEQRLTMVERSVKHLERVNRQRPVGHAPVDQDHI